MSKKYVTYVVTLIIGLLLIIFSYFLRAEELKQYSGICIGVGAGLIGMSIAKLFMKRYEQKNPCVAKLNKIDFEDERNTIIRNKAKSRAADFTQYLIIGLTYITILIDAPLWVTLVTIGVYLFQNVLGLILMSKYNKEM